MKKLLLLSALLIFACSSDDNTETFLERFDGVVWDGEGLSYLELIDVDDPFFSSQLYFAFINTPQSKVRFVSHNTEIFCWSHLLNSLTSPYNSFPDIEVDFTIIENSSNVLTYSWYDDTQNEDLIGTSGTITYNANNQGDILSVETIWSPADSEEETTNSYQCVRVNIPFNCN